MTDSYIIVIRESGTKVSDVIVRPANHRLICIAIPSNIM